MARTRGSRFARLMAITLAAMTVFALAMTPGAANAATPASVPWTISGHVYGPDGTTGIVGVSVRVEDYNDSSLFWTTTTTTGGAYMVTTPSGGGDYRVGFDPTIYDTGHSTYYVSQWWDAKSNYAAAASVSLDATTSQATGIDAVLEVGARLTGTMKTESGTGLAGRLELYTWHAGPQSADVVTQAQTTNGTYTMYVPAGTYRLGGLPDDAHYLEGYYGGGAAVRDATDITLVAGTTSSGKDVVALQGGTVSGLVTDHAGVAAPGVTVMVGLVANPGAMDFQAVTAADGKYAILGIPAGTYAVRFAPFDYNDAHPTAKLVSQWYTDKSAEQASMVTVTKGGTTANINATLDHGGSMAGTVRDESGQPVQGVEIYPTDGSDWFGANAVTAVDGTYRLDTLERRTTQSVYFDPQIANQSYDKDNIGVTKAVAVDTTALKSLDVTLPLGGRIVGTVSGGGSPLAGVDVNLWGGTRMDDPRYTAITQTDGTYLVRGVTPGRYLCQFETVNYNDSNGTSFQSQYWSGKVSPAAADALQVNRAGTETANATLTDGAHVHGTVTDSVSGDPLADVELMAYPAGPHYGSVSTRTDVNGQYDLYGVPAGTPVLLTARDDYSSYAQTFWNGRTTEASADQQTFTPGQSFQADFALQPVATVWGLVKDGVGDPIEGASVRVLRSDGTGYDDVYTDADGYYYFDWVDPGTYKIVASAPGYMATWFASSATASGATSLTFAAGGDYSGNDITLPTGGGGISGTAKDSSGLAAPAGERAAYLYEPIGSGWRLAGTCELAPTTGAYSFSNLRPQSYRLAFESTRWETVARYIPHQGYPTGPDERYGADVTVTGTAITTVPAYTLKSPGAITRVATVDQAGRTLEGSAVSLYMFTPSGWADVTENTMGPIYVTGSDGSLSSARFTMLPGTYHIGASHAGYNDAFYLDKADLASGTDVVVGEAYDSASVGVTQTLTAKTLTGPQDTTAPSTAMGGVPASWSTSDVLFTLTPTDADSPTGISTFYDFGAGTKTYTGSGTVSTEGTTTVSYWSRDVAGNEETPHKTGTIRIDKSLPTVGSDAQTTYANSAVIKINGADSTSGLQYLSYKLDAATTQTVGVSGMTIAQVVGAWPAGAYTLPAITTLGSHTLSYYATDAAGNKSGVVTKTFNVVTDTISVSASNVTPNPAFPTQTLTFTASGFTDSLGHTATGYEWRSSRDGVLTSSPVPSTTFTKSGLSVGTHTIGVRVQCSGGAWSSWVDYATPVVVKADTVAAFIDTPSGSVNTTSGLSVSFVGHGTDADHTITGYQWLCNGVAFSTQQSPSVATLPVGTNTITLKVQCSIGTWSAESAARTVVIAQAPSAPMPVWRFYNFRTGTHFYTADPSEKNNVAANMRSTYSLDGVSYTVNTANTANSTPLYRFYNLKTGTHFYTADASEKYRVQTTMASTYHLDGVAYNVCSTPVTGAITVWRFYNFKTGTHFYTADTAEKANVQNNMRNTYSLDGPGFYLAP